MIKIDLITGFLGSGKTTFIKKYAKYLIDSGKRIGILENDYGAVNVDMMLLQELMGDNCHMEMVAGGCDADCHRRRFKTKLIAMGMEGYDRVIVEPSGIFDVDEFFDALYEEPLCRWYEIGNVIAIVDAKLENNLSARSEFILASQIADAGKIILSKYKNASKKEINDTIAHLNKAMEGVKCTRKFEKEIVCRDWDTFTCEDFESFLNCGYVAEDYVKAFGEYGDYQTLYFMNLKMNEEELRSKVSRLIEDSSCGNIFRIKGFVSIGHDEWLEVNATRNNIMVKPIAKGQEILIVIGENLEEDKISEHWRK